jgi:multiple sugar transport system permease protein
VSLLWKWILNPARRRARPALAAVGIEGPGWWTSPDWADAGVVLASVWKDLGYVAVILLAGLQAIPPELREAAQLDGAGAWRRLRNVTLPLLSPSLFFVVVLSLINGFQVFDQVWVMTQGRPGRRDERRGGADRQIRLFVRAGRVRVGDEHRAVRDHHDHHLGAGPPAEALGPL